MTFIMDVSDTATRIFDTPLFDLQPGKYIDFYLSALYTDGTENFSPAYAYKYTGKPVIFSIKSLK